MWGGGGGGGVDVFSIVPRDQNFAKRILLYSAKIR